MAAVGDHHDVRQRLRQHKVARGAHRHPVNQAHHDERTFGERVADQVAAGIGSWTFLMIQTVLIVFWIIFNVVALFVAHWDPYPFILLNLMLSLQAAYAAPLLMLAGVRQAEKDRLTLEHAAAEADKGADQINRILNNIRENTRLTLDILAECER